MKLKNIFNILGYSNLGNFFSFIYFITITRYLSKNDFSLITSITNLAVGAAYIFSFIVPIISYEISKNNKKKNLQKSYLSFLKINYIFFFFLIIFFILAKEFFFLKFKFSSYLILILTPIIIFLNILIYIQLGFLSGLKRFILQSKYYAIQHFIKIALILILSFFYYKNYYPLIATSISMLIFVFFAHVTILKYFDKNKNSNTISISLKNILKSFLITIIGAIIIYADIIISRNVFDYEASSKFNILSSLSKINYYFLSSLIFTIIPIFNQKSILKNKYFLKISLIFFIFIICSNLFYYLFSNQLISMLFKLNFNNISFLMVKLNTSSIFFTASLMILNYLYTQKYFKKIFLTLIFTIFYLSILFNIKDIKYYVDTILIFNFLLLIFLISLLFKYKNFLKK
jgi:O-antigen/teichoic acid export membrane protein